MDTEAEASPNHTKTTETNQAEPIETNENNIKEQNNTNTTEDYDMTQTNDQEAKNEEKTKDQRKEKRKDTENKQTTSKDEDKEEDGRNDPMSTENNATQNKTSEDEDKEEDRSNDPMSTEHNATQNTEEQEKETNKKDKKSKKKKQKDANEKNKKTKKDTKNKNKTKKGQTSTKQKTLAPTTKYFDVQLMLQATDAKKQDNAQEILNTCSDKLKTWLKSIQSVKPSFKLLTINPSAETITKLHDTSNFPTTHGGMKDFFQGVRPNKAGGRLYMKVLAEFEGTARNLLNETEWYHQQNKEIFRLSAIQAASVEIVGWLLYSLRAFDVKSWSEKFTKLCERPVSVRWMRISDGNKPVSANYNDEPKALHIECATEDYDTIKSCFQSWYSSSATKFPRDVRMRFIAPFKDLVDIDSIKKFHILRERQKGWNDQVQAKIVTSIIPMAIDTPIPDHTITLRQWIMNIHATAEGTKGQLFQSIEPAYRQPGYNVSYHPAKTAEASTTLKGLYARAKAKFGTKVTSLFTTKAQALGERMTWDEKTGKLTSDDDVGLAAAVEADDDMTIFQVPTAHNPSTPAFIFQRERDQDDDSVSTMNPKKKQKTSPATVTPEKQTKRDDASTSTGCSSLTQGTVGTRLTTVEEQLSNISIQFKKQDDRFNDIFSMLQSMQQGKVAAPNQATKQKEGSQANHPPAGMDVEDPASSTSGL